MIRLAVVSSRIFDCPCSLNDIVGGILRPARMRADVVRRLVERVAGRDVGDQADGELPVRALERRRPEAALDGGDVVDAAPGRWRTARSAGRSPRCRAAGSRARGS